MRTSSIIPKRLPQGVWVVAIASTIIMSGFGMIVPLIPVYGKQLGATTGELGFLMAGLFIGRLLAQFPAGFATDHFGRRPVLLVATLGYALANAGYALSNTINFLIAFRLIQGLAAGFFSVSARSLVSDLGGLKLRGTAQGVYSSSINLGFVLGPMTAGTIAAVGIDIRVLFWTGAILSLMAFAALSFVKSPIKNTAFSTTTKLSPIAGLETINKQIGLLSFAHFSFMIGLSVIMVLFPIAGKEEIRGGIAFVGPAYAMAGISGMLFGPVTGRASDRLGRVPIMILGTCLAAAEGTVLLLSRNPWIIGAGFFLGGFGVAAFSNGLHAAIADLTSRAGRGRVTGIVGLAGESGGIAGSLLAPLAWKLTDLRTPFCLQVIFCVVTFVFVIALGRYKPRHSSPGAVIREPLIPG